MLSDNELHVDAIGLQQLVDSSVKLSNLNQLTCEVSLHLLPCDNRPEPVSLYADLTPSYPTKLPSIRVRANDRTKAEIHQLQADLLAHLTEEVPGEPCLFEAFTWLQQHVVSQPLTIDKPRHARMSPSYESMSTSTTFTTPQSGRTSSIGHTTMDCMVSAWWASLAYSVPRVWRIRSTTTFKGYASFPGRRCNPR